jgi:hypothetical protein
MGVDRMVVTHAQFEVVNMSFEQMKQAAAKGAKLELCAMGTLMGPEAHLAWMRHWRRVKVEETAAAVKEVGAQNFISRLIPTFIEGDSVWAGFPCPWVCDSMPGERE